MEEKAAPFQKGQARHLWLLTGFAARPHWSH
jgi:hypothetical protein